MLKRDLFAFRFHLLRLVVNISVLYIQGFYTGRETLDFETINRIWVINAFRKVKKSLYIQRQGRSKADLKTLEKDWGPQIKSYRKSRKRCFWGTEEVGVSNLDPRHFWKATTI